MMPDTLDGAPAIRSYFAASSGIGSGREDRVSPARPLGHHRDRVVEVKARAPGLPGLLDPEHDLLGRPVERRVDRRHRTVVAEQQPRRPQRGEHPQRLERDFQVEVRRRRRGPLVTGLGNVDPRGVAHVQVAAHRVDQTHVMLGVPGRVVALQLSPASQVDHARALDRANPVGRGRRERAEEGIEFVAVHHSRAGHEPGRIGQMPGAQFVHDDLSAGEHPGDIADAAGVVQVDVRDHDRGEVVRADAERGQGIPDHRSRGRGAGLDEARPV